MILNDKQIGIYFNNDPGTAERISDRGRIYPFLAEQERVNGAGEKILSRGCSSFGYDISCADSFRVFTNINSTIVDPKYFNNKNFVEVKGDICIIPPNSFALAVSKEYVHMPDDVLGICVGKSTYARCGIVVNVTPIEPGWKGHITLEFSNTTNLPAIIYANEGCAQLVFFKGEVPAVTYNKRSGKYMDQPPMPVPPKV